MKKSLLIVFSGLVWFIVGSLLLSKGINLIVFSLSEGVPAHFSLIQKLTPRLGLMRSALFLISIGLFMGYVKGRYILIKSVNRVVNRILALEEPFALSQVYSPLYLLLVLSMVCVGVTFRFLPFASDVRGTVDLTIGAALMNGSLLYFRCALAARRS